MKDIEIYASKSLRLVLRRYLSNQFEVTQFGPRYIRAYGSLSNWEFDVGEDGRHYLTYMAGVDTYMVFALSPEESRAVRETFEPLGLRVDPDSPPSAAPSPATDHEAVAATPAPLGGEDGTSPLAHCTARGALDSNTRESH